MGERRARSGVWRDVEVCAAIGDDGRRRLETSLEGGRIEGVEVRDTAAREAHGDAWTTRKHFVGVVMVPTPDGLRVVSGFVHKGTAVLPPSLDDRGMTVPVADDALGVTNVFVDSSALHPDTVLGDCF